MYREILIVILVIYMHFVYIQNIFNIYYWTYNIKYCKLNLKCFEMVIILEANTCFWVIIEY